MFVKQILYPTKTKSIIFRVFNTYGPGEKLDYLKKGIVSIFCSFLWKKKKPIIVKGSLKRFRDLTFIDDCVNILIKASKIKLKNKDEIFNLSSGKIYTVKKLISEIIKVNNEKKYPIKIAKGTKGDSFGFHTSNRRLRLNFKYKKFISLREGLTKYFEWINKLPKKGSINKFHPLKISKKNN